MLKYLPGALNSHPNVVRVTNVQVSLFDEFCPLSVKSHVVCSRTL